MVPDRVLFLFLTIETDVTNDVREAEQQLFTLVQMTSAHMSLRMTGQLTCHVCLHMLFIPEVTYTNTPHCQ